MVFLNAVQGVLSIMLLMGVGYFLSYKGWFDDKAGKLFSRMVTGLSLPAYMIYNLMSTYDRDKLMHLTGGLVVPFVSMGVCYSIGVLVAKLIKVGPKRFGIFCSIFGLSNTIFVGLPVNLALFGDQSIPYVLLYYIGNTTYFWTIGTYGIRRDGESGDKRIFTVDNVKKIFSPPLTAFLFSIVLILLGVQLPKSIMETSKYLGNLTTPMAVLFIGMVMYSVNLKEIRINKEMLALLAGRFILAPAVVFALCDKLPLPVLMKQVFVIQSAMPAMTQTSIIAQAYGADHKYAAVMTTVTTLVSLFMIPVYMVLLNSGLF